MLEEGMAEEVRLGLAAVAEPDVDRLLRLA